MLASGAAHAAVIALGIPLATSHQVASFPPTASCAFCGGSTAAAGTSAFRVAGRTTPDLLRQTWLPCARRQQNQLLRTPFSVGHPAAGGRRGRFEALRVGPIIVAAAAAATNRWSNNNESGDDEWDEGEDRPGSDFRGRVGRSRRTPWEDIQWSNAPSRTSDNSGGGRGGGRSRMSRVPENLEEEEGEDDDAEPISDFSKLDAAESVDRRRRPLPAEGARRTTRRGGQDRRPFVEDDLG